MKKLIIIFIGLILLIFPKSLRAAANYTIEKFESVITIEQDSTLTVTETIEINIDNPMHGIFRIIPVTYSAKGRTIKAKFNLISITDEVGNSYKYNQNYVGQSVKLKIGDPNKTISGTYTYIISYQLDKVLQRFKEDDELYWNVTGAEWDTEIKTATALVISPFARIVRTECFAGTFGSKDKNCEMSTALGKAQFNSTAPLGTGRDFSIVVALNKDNQLIFPGLIDKTLDSIMDNWGYPVSLFPLLIIGYFWLKKGRDRRYLTENIYYKPNKPATKTVSPFERKHLPMVYHPIQGITPAQVGTIIDERVDIHDVISEIVELARLGHLKIEKIEKKKIIGKKNGYAFTKLEKNTRSLKKYQKYLLRKLFEKPTVKDNYVILSDLKNNFYQSLDEFKKRLYQNLADEQIFAGNPEKIRTKWLMSFIGLFIVAEILVVSFAIRTFNFGPFIFSFLSLIPGIFLARSMPRRTAWGYSLFRQIGGLRWYLKKGKWRHEINEKHLFIEEILPLAVSLGVVTQLANQMKELNLKPPTYFAGTTIGTFSSDIQGFRSTCSSTLVSAPGSSGRSSWSGGSGFSGGGGSSGGGFGGGGGGGW